jgi:hypothetical protein
MEDREVNININVAKGEPDDDRSEGTVKREFRYKILGQIALTVVVVGIAVILLITSGGAITAPTVGYVVLSTVAGLYAPAPKFK